MKIVIADIPDEGLYIEFKESLSLDDASLISPAIAGLQLTKAGKEIIITGSLSANLLMVCSRCVNESRVSLNVTVEVVYHPIEEITAERHTLRDDEMDVGFYQGEELDVTELVREQILLNMQMKPLCREDCKGICPLCGTDLNTGICGCAKHEVDPRLEVLKKFFEKEKE